MIYRLKSNHFKTSLCINVIIGPMWDIRFKSDKVTVSKETVPKPGSTREFHYSLLSAVGQCWFSIPFPWYIKLFRLIFCYNNNNRLRNQRFDDYTTNRYLQSSIHWPPSHPYSTIFALTQSPYFRFIIPLRLLLVGAVHYYAVIQIFLFIIILKNHKLEM